MSSIGREAESGLGPGGRRRMDSIDGGCQPWSNGPSLIGMSPIHGETKSRIRA